MQSTTLYLISVAAGLAMLFSATAVLAQTERRVSANAVSDTSAAPATCPAGYHWEAATYLHGGKWRDGHCARDSQAR